MFHKKNSAELAEGGFYNYCELCLKDFVNVLFHKNMSKKYNYIYY